MVQDVGELSRLRWQVVAETRRDVVVFDVGSWHRFGLLLAWRLDERDVRLNFTAITLGQAGIVSKKR